MRRVAGSHPPNIKNRSSKHLVWLTKMKPAVRSMSNKALQSMVTKEAKNEIARRLRKAKKNDESPL